MSDITLDRLYKLININITINDDYDNFEVVLQRLLHAIEVITNSETTSLLVYDANKKDLIFRFATGHTAHDLMGLKVPEGQGVAHTVAKTRKGIIVNNPEQFGHYPVIDKKINYNTKTLMAFPLLDYNGDVFGVVEACNKKGGAGYTQDDFKLLTIFCQQAERTIRHALHIHTLKRTIANLHTTVKTLRTPPLIYVSKEMKNNFVLMKKVANSDSPMLITGNKGTGKTLFARHIHDHNHRKAQQLIELNCFELVKESENLDQLRIKLWGIDKNYKIGIKQNTVGLFEQANGGTVIIKEIGLLPIEVQKEIQELLTHKLYTKVDSQIPNSIDVRILCTSTMNINKLIAEGKFSEELFFIINSLSIHIPTLNSRIEDIEEISIYYMDYFIKMFKKNIVHVEPEVYIILKRYIWKYNLHSLLNTISHLVLYCEHEVLTRQYIASYIHSISEANQDTFPKTKEGQGEDAEEEYNLELKDAVNRFKTQYIHKVLLSNNWNHTKTAKILDIQRSYLSRLVRDYNLKSKAILDIKEHTEG